MMLWMVEQSFLVRLTSQNYCLTYVRENEMSLMLGSDKTGFQRFYVVKQAFPSLNLFSGLLYCRRRLDCELNLSLDSP